MNVKLQKIGYFTTTVCLVISLILRLFHMTFQADILMVIGGVLLTLSSIMRLIENKKKDSK